MSDQQRARTRPVTSVDVARLAGVSRSAVSRTFTPGASVAPATRERVYAAARTLGYRVNSLARSLINQRSDLVGVVVTNMDNPFRARQVEALTLALMQRNLRPVLLVVSGAGSVEQVIDQLLQYSVSGVIITSDAPPGKICDECARHGVPIVLVNKGDELPLVDRVVSDVEAAGRMAADVLLEGGCRRPAVLASGTRSYTGQQRMKAFLRRCEERGQPARHLDIAVNDHACGLVAAGTVAPQIAAGGGPDGIFCVSDYLALGLLGGLRQAGITVPGAVQVVGHDNIAQAAWPEFNLTTFDQPVALQAEQVLDLLQARIEEPDRPAVLLPTPVSFIRRGTTLSAG
ncbi:LacI family DNA-binding transcriptional regulator [Radicibacter daui]|uniref:LacI family DNA-binding transcriptional regulator n=1 Tax=Radicibacter daui TaxID=3064829 RepID=UPI004046BFDF